MSSVKQTGNTAEIIVAGDYYASCPNQIERIYQKLCSEMESENVSVEKAPFFEYYTNRVADTKYKGLEEKLSIAGFNSGVIEYAMRAKLRYAKNVAKTQMYFSGQALHVIFLETAYSCFQKFVVPKIGKIPPDELLERNEDRVQVELKKLVDKSDFTLTPMELDGIVFFLTGNCLLKWHNESLTTQ